MIADSVRALSKAGRRSVHSSLSKGTFRAIIEKLLENSEAVPLAGFPARTIATNESRLTNLVIIGRKGKHFHNSVVPCTKN